jgi:hypothetical protein
MAQRHGRLVWTVHVDLCAGQEARLQLARELRLTGEIPPIVGK